jgi:hypothetical protein
MAHEAEGGCTPKQFQARDIPTSQRCSALTAHQYCTSADYPGPDTCISRPATEAAATAPEVREIITNCSGSPDTPNPP